MCTGLGIKTSTVLTPVAQRVEAAVETLAAKDSAHTEAQLAALHAELRADSVKRSKSTSYIKDDTLFHARHPNLLHIYDYVDHQDGTTQQLYIKKTFWGWFWALVVFSPLIFAVFSLLGFVVGVIREGPRVARANRKMDEDHAAAMHAYNSKPTAVQMNAYIQDNLSLMPDIEMSLHKKSEEDLKGLTLFINSEFNYKEEDRDEDDYDGSLIEYTIVLLEEDCVTIMRSDWCVFEDDTRKTEIEQISYGDVGNIKMTDDELSFGGITIDIPDCQVFEYQDDDLGDVHTFSESRTSDVRTFVVALRKLVQAYKNSFRQQ
jgi:ribosomal 30S subunit maturation factor RimM